ncbi:MAG: hypothetical protein ACXWCT_15435, partial [Flavitalea sp.]
MRKFSVLIFFLICSILASAQTYSVQWGEEMKLKKGSIDFEIINADETGVYVLEGQARVTSYFVVGYTLGSSYKLIKFDKNYNAVYEQDFKKPLKGLSFKSIQFLRKNMYLFAEDYNKKEKQYTVYGVKINTSTGEPYGEMKELAKFQLDSKKDDFKYTLAPTPDSTKWLLVGDVSSESTSSLAITTLDQELNSKGVTNIHLTFDPKLFTLEEVLQTSDGKFLLLGKRYENVPTGKKNKTTRVFTKYVFSKYNAKGKKELDLPTDFSSHYAMNGKVLLLPNGEMALAGFYSNNANKKEVNGTFISKIDLSTGAVLKSSFKEISASMLDKASTDDSELDDEDKKAKKEREKGKNKDDDEDGLSKDFIIKAVVHNPATGSLLLIAELSKLEWYTRTQYDSYTKSSKSITYYTFTNSDLLIINANKNGEIDWINTLPKKQIETIKSGSGGFSSGSNLAGFYARSGGMPFYSSFAYMLQENKLIFLINDHAQNTSVKKLGDPVREINNFKKSAAFAVSLDLATGSFSRKLLLNNEDDPVLMPRFSFVVDKDFYMPAMKMKTLSKTEFKIGKISVKKI